MRCFAGFALSHDVAYFLNEAAAIGQLRLHYPEDQVVATWLYGLVLERLNDERFHDVEVAYLAPEYASTQVGLYASQVSALVGSPLALLQRTRVLIGFVCCSIGPPN